MPYRVMMSSNVIETYSVAGAKVYIQDIDGKGFYIVEEPLLLDDEKSVVDEILTEAIVSKDLNDPEGVIINLLSKRNMDAQKVSRIHYWVRRRLLYDEMTVPLLDPEIEEIECMGPGTPITVIHRKYSNYIRLYTNLIMTRDEEIISIIEKLATKSNKSVNIAKPFLEFSLPEGHRVAATISSEISSPGSTFDIRKFPISPISLVKLIINGSISKELAAYIWLMMDYKPFYLIVGSTGSGKTTLLSALLNFTHPDSKIVSIEDTPELNLSGRNWISLFSRSNVNSYYDVSIADLSRLALRYRPDYLIIGEVRGREIETLIHASASGHGSLSTFHGGKPSDVITRIVSLVPRDLAIMFINNLWGIIMVSRRITDEGKFIKAVSALYEIKRTKGKPVFKKVSWWSNTEKKYIPGNLEKLVERSEKLRYISELYEIPIADLVSDLRRREEFLTYLQKQNIIDNSLIVKNIANFYRKVKINVEQI
ncbi:MAG: type II/IV secretion system ATPase subunit [Metallosphaera yellowstonensis]|jgi:flagellar protein FlaI|uniref:ATPase, type IV secretory pathway VirB11 component like protein n=1 Tax=Metallosphaera yellowstonensis MK1 TaxID=671065 RepID=H2C8W4_9CREN|nr:type II/IV secretion system ATPase subunit [Metallosphaera yellowstonensis]EHP68590.1 ATPase, type IV secretory pathway VirB11 component like protein [Metallosphaera yellowstonensis MK1]